MSSSETDQTIAARTARWVRDVVIGLNLCPFAKSVQAKGLVKYVVSRATTPRALLDELKRELGALASAAPSEVDTTLLIHPDVLREFADYNEFLGDADELLGDLGLEGELQVASFHPDYCFADSASNDPANYTNRSPYPMLHLLREQSITQALDTFPDPTRIYERNIATLRALSPADIERLLAADD